MVDYTTRKELRLAELRVLLVDDNADMRALVKSLIHAMGIKKVVECADGGEALHELKIQSYDLIITDWMMQPIDGIEFVQMIRTAPDSPCPKANIIMLTGNTGLEQVMEARDAGITEFLAKPISAEKLYTRIISVLKSPRSFVSEKSYSGPDRRRRDSDNYDREERRGARKKDTADQEPDAAPESDAEKDTEKDEEVIVR